MLTLNLKPTHKPVQAYYDALRQYELIRVTNETAVRAAFQNLLESCSRQFNWTLVLEWEVKRPQLKPVRVDGALVDLFRLTHGYWEAKDQRDDLAKEVKKKFAIGYPKDNIIFQAPERAILYQNNRQVADEDITNPENLVGVLKTFFEYQPPAFEQWEEAVAEFQKKVPELAAALVELIEKERKTNAAFIRAFGDFTELCRQSINPNLSVDAVREMLIQHLLTERIFRTVFNNPDFTRRNVIAAEIEKVIDALTSQAFSRADFLRKFDRFYKAVEVTAATIEDYSQKQHFLNTVYEKFFQGFSVRVADTHGIVYTPQPIVSFMVKSVEDILQKEFGKSLSDRDVHILDPFVGTGNFIVRAMQEMKKTALPYKYKNELHCNEVMLLPYYIASMNIEHEFYEMTGNYEPFAGICLVDTFELSEGKQLSFFTTENTARVERQKQSPIFVVIGNPPYNTAQVNENDNNKNRKYKTMDQRISETYAKDSKATLVNKLSDPYVKAIRWASDRIGEDGVIAFITNNSYLDQIAFDGMRMHLEQDFDEIYALDLGGNVRKNPKLSGTTHNVFGIQVGVSINLFIRKKSQSPRALSIYFARVDEYWRKEEKYKFLEESQHRGNITWQALQPDQRHTWLTEGLKEDFETFVRLGSKETKYSPSSDVEAIFKLYSLGVATNRDVYVYSFQQEEHKQRVETFIDIYNDAVEKRKGRGAGFPIEKLIDVTDPRIKWTRQVKASLEKLLYSKLLIEQFRVGLYRPFTKKHLYFDDFWNEEQYQMPQVFPCSATELENRIICAGGYGRKVFSVLMSNHIPDLNFYSDPQQSFPFYTYDEDGANRRENITDWALEQFRAHYGDPAITRWDIFYYVYAVLHHPAYRERYAANLKRELPRLPFAPDFRAFAEAGRRLADLHVHYEQQPEYPLERVENPGEPLNWRVEKMKLSKDKTALVYNDFLTLSGIPAEAFDYRLGNRSALEWVIDQYQVSTDKRSGIVNDPNRLDDPEYIVRLIGQVITVSLETVRAVRSLPELFEAAD